MQKGEIDEFEVNKGVRQIDYLLTTLFNMVLEYAVKRIRKVTKIIAHADDEVLIIKREI